VIASTDESNPEKLQGLVPKVLLSETKFLRLLLHINSRAERLQKRGEELESRSFWTEITAKAFVCKADRFI